MATLTPFPSTDNPLIQEPTMAELLEQLLADASAPPSPSSHQETLP
jgi:hypothetical protein